MSVSRVRPMRPEEEPAVLEMMRALWPDCDDETVPPDESVFVWERPGGGLGGFVSYAVRPWAEGARTTPVPYIEGWWVAPDLRRRGVGRALIVAVEEWSRANGFTELASDVELHNDVSLEAHGRLGFEPTLRVQYFRKGLG